MIRLRNPTDVEEVMSVGRGVGGGGVNGMGGSAGTGAGCKLMVVDITGLLFCFLIKFFFFMGQ